MAYNPFNPTSWLSAAKKYASYTPQQQKIAKTIAKKTVPSWKLGKSGSNMFIMNEAYKVADELFAPKQQQQQPQQQKPKQTAEAAPVETKVEVTPETKALQDETKKLMDEIETLKGQLTDSDTQFEEYKKQQDEIAAQTQATAAAQSANKAMAGLAPTLQIGGAAAAGPMKTGTSAFKIKKDKKPTSTITPLNIGSSSPLNI